MAVSGRLGIDPYGLAVAVEDLRQEQSPCPTVCVEKQNGPEKKSGALLHKILLLSESADIQQVYVQGKLVHSTSV